MLFLGLAPSLRGKHHQLLNDKAKALAAISEITIRKLVMNVVYFKE